MSEPIPYVCFVGSLVASTIQAVCFFSEGEDDTWKIQNNTFLCLCYLREVRILLGFTIAHEKGV